MYTTILWDLDNTLLSFNKAEKYAFDRCMTMAGLTPGDALLQCYDRINTAYWQMLERGEITREVLLKQRFATFFQEIGMNNVDVPLIRDTYQQLLGSVYYYMEGALELCTRLHQTHRQYIVTNGVASTQKSRLSLSHLDELMDGCFISEELGYEKPALAFFEKCFAQIPDLKKEETIIVGDSLTSDMQGGIGAGIACCWYNPDKKPIPAHMDISYSIQRLDELLPIVSAPVISSRA